MVFKLKCDCENRIGIEINSHKLFLEIKEFFETEVKKGIFVEEKDKKPYYVWKSNEEWVFYFATKWYRCKVCGCLWEFQYPDFPAKGFVKKYPDGIYTGTETVEALEGGIIR